MANPKTRSVRFYLLMGIGWGLIMFTFTEIVRPLMEHEPVTFISTLISFPLWLLGGIFFGYILKNMGRQNQS